jgi:hypothetical protein
MRRVTIGALMLCLAVFSLAFAQTTNATVGGTVSDASGALIPDAEANPISLDINNANSPVFNRQPTTRSFA